MIVRQATKSVKRQTEKARWDDEATDQKKRASWVLVFLKHCDHHSCWLEDSGRSLATLGSAVHKRAPNSGYKIDIYIYAYIFLYIMYVQAHASTCLSGMLSSLNKLIQAADGQSIYGDEKN